MASLSTHGRTIEVTHLCKVLYPGEDVMKGDVIAYYDRIAETMMPHVRGRIASIHTLPEGIRGVLIHRRDVRPHLPRWVRTATVDRGRTRQIVVDEPATLALLAEQGCITPHVRLSRASTPDRPDRIVFDLDPCDCDCHAFELARRAARLLRSLLADVGLAAFVMTTGSRGLHVHVPILPDVEFARARAFARRIAERCAGIDGTRVTAAGRREVGVCRVAVGHFRNGHARTTLAPYGLRARPRAPVATPIGWEELEDPRLDPRSFTISSIAPRIEAEGDPWQRIDDCARRLPTDRKQVAFVRPLRAPTTTNPGPEAWKVLP